jgi:ubiquinone/menaquinone biosynthesis C-methylase UbiE
MTGNTTNKAATLRTRKRYDRLAVIYDLIETPVERFRFASWRARLNGRLHGEKILEVGVGTGKNLPFYPDGVKAAAIDISPPMLNRARRKAQSLGASVELMEMDVQDLRFADHTFDTVFGTFVFCSVPDPVLGLQELRRVCKPGGKLLLLEHMRPDNPVFGFFFDAFNPIAVRMMGANINRRTMENIRRAGWKVRVEERLISDVVRWIEAEP